MIAIALPGGGYGVLAPDADAIDLVPGLPVPESDGGPAVRLLPDGQVTYVSLGTRWPVPEEWLRTALPAQHPTPRYTGRASQLRVAVVGTPTLTLSVSRVAGGTPSPLTTVNTSGYPPFTAILSIAAGPEAAAAIRAARAGEHGRALLTISARIPADLPLDKEVLADTALAIDGLTVTATADLADWHTPPTVS
ncbi:MAG: hypothetical protein QM713_01175 [Arachnia sp.]